MPRARLVAVQGLEQPLAGPPSRRQVTVAVASLTSKATTASVELVEATGPLVMLTAGNAAGTGVTATGVTGGGGTGCAGRLLSGRSDDAGDGDGDRGRKKSWD